MSVNGSNNFLNIEDANLRVRNGSVHAQGMTIGGAIVSASHGLQSVSDTSNTTSNTLQFTNATTAFKATSNIELTSASKIIVESNVLMDFKTLGQIEFPGSTVEQEYPPRALTGYETLVEGHGVFTVYSTGGLYDNGSGGNLPWTAFNKFTGTFNDGTSWVSEDTAGAGAGGNYNNGGSSGYGGSHRLASNTPLGEYLVICLPYPIALNSYSLSNLSGASGFGAADFPRDYIIYGSNDDVNWEVVDTRSDQEAGGLAPAAHVSAGYLGYTNNYTVSGNNIYSKFAIVITDINSKPWYDHDTTNASYAGISEWRLFGTPGPTTLDKGSLTLGRSLDVPRVSRYDVDTETPRPEKLLVDFDTTVNSSPTDISGKGNHGTFKNNASYSAPDKAFKFSAAGHYIQAELNNSETGNQYHSVSLWFKITSGQTSNWRCIFECGENPRSGTSDISLYIRAGQDQLSFSNGSGHMYSDTLTNLYFQWHHIVLTYDGANRKMYLDGVLIKTLATTSWSGVANMTLRIGRTNANGEGIVNGLISNFKLYWQTALEPSEVQKLYRLGRTGRSMVISDTAVGIGKVPGAQLDVRGNLNVDGVITNQQRPAFYVWRDGTGNNVEAIGHGGQSRLAVTGVITNWDSKRIDTAGTFDLSNGRYYIPVSGLYMLIGVGVYRYQSGNGILEASFYVNGSNVGPRGISYNRGNTTSEHHTVTITFMRFMNVGDYVQMGVPVAQSACDLYYGDNLGYFSGYLLG